MHPARMLRKSIHFGKVSVDPSRNMTDAGFQNIGGLKAVRKTGTRNVPAYRLNDTAHTVRRI
jgi:hypothetical protein